MFLFIDNYDSFSYNIIQYFQQLGESPTVICNDDPRLLELASDPQLEKVVISPGPSNPEKAGYCLEFLDLLPHHIPVLGVCLGMQCLGHHAGCPVVRGPRVMHGKTSQIEHGGTGLYKGIKSPMTIGRYHSLVVKCPDNHPALEITARDDDGEAMSLRYKDRPWVGVQYHPESILTEQGMELLANFPAAIIGAHARAINISPLIEQLAERKNLTGEQAELAFGALMDGELTAAQSGAFLLTLRSKGETSTEMAAAVRCALQRATAITGITGDSIDVVGTGGDGKRSFNCSTATAITLAALGYQVTKHGNRAVSSSSGAGDVLERLGYPASPDPSSIVENLQRDGFSFALAPHFHPCFKNIGPIRSELGVRTLFNLLGPLINPSKPNHILLGVAKPELVVMIAEVLAQGHYKRAMVLCGSGGYDEATAFGVTPIKLVDGGEIRDISFDPAAYGFAPPTSEDELMVETKEEASDALMELLHGRGNQAMSDMLSINLALAIQLLEPTLSMEQCVTKARSAVAQGVGARVIARWGKLL